MCGICGMAGKGIIKDDLNFFKQLLYVTALRGFDSTGVATVSNPGRSSENIRIEKDAISAWEFIKIDDKKSYQECLLDRWTPELFMGHCRAATVGKVTKENAHPFDIGSIVGYHNGTLVDERYSKHPTKTDSELLMEDIEKYGVEETLNGLSVASAYAVAVYHKGEGIISLARNHHRPFFIAFNQKRSVVYWASEEGMLRFIAKRNGINLGDKVYYLSPYVVYNLDLDKIETGNEAPWTVTNLKDKTKFFKQKKTKKERKAERNLKKRSGFPGFISGYGSSASMYGSDGERLTEEDCIFCGKELTKEEIEKYEVDDDGVNYYTCEDCFIVMNDHLKQSNKETEEKKAS